MRITLLGAAGSEVTGVPPLLERARFASLSCLTSPATRRPVPAGPQNGNRDPFGTSTKEELPMATILLLCLWSVTPPAVLGGLLLLIASDDF